MGIVGAAQSGLATCCALQEKFSPEMRFLIVHAMRRHRRTQSTLEHPVKRKLCAYPENLHVFPHPSCAYDRLSGNDNHKAVIIWPSNPDR